MRAQAVEFVGGPLDGHTHHFEHSPEQLPPVAKLLMSADFVRVLIGQVERDSAPPTSTAFYCLDGDRESLRYYHLGSFAVEEASLGQA
ncbi:MAG: hypothetical protein KY475_16195 [Planctomycetes bacterium]|nr:hypothetical protein [Planctomycetota bacterium]